MASSLDAIVNDESGEKIKVFVTTWNMGNAESSGFGAIFTEEKNYLQKYDLFAIGLQESTYKGGAPNFDSIAHLKADLEKTFAGDHFLVQHCYRAQLQLFVFARLSLRQRISNIEQSIENTGFLHVFPNKGGLLITLHIDGSKFAFISCHLTAHEGVKHCEERNGSIIEILGGVRAGDKRIDITEQFHHVFWMGDMNYRTTFDKKNVPISTKKYLKELEKQNENEKGEANPNEIVLSEEKKMIDDSDAESDDDESSTPNKQGKSGKNAERAANMRKVLDMVAKENWAEILALDELNREIASGRVMNDFIALQPSFPPTFKRIRKFTIKKLPPDQLISSKQDGSTKNYLLKKDEDTTTEYNDDKPVATYYDPKRIPSYTDRILYKSMPAFAGAIKPIFFDSCELAFSSDHKPVRAGFEVRVIKGTQGIIVDRGVARWKGRVSENTSGKRADVNLLRVTVSDLKGQDLEEMDSQIFGGGSDPYIIITTDPGMLLLDKGVVNPVKNAGVTSPIIYHNLNPVWKDPMKFALASCDLKGLAVNASLIFSVFDHDRANADDLIGVFSIPFKTILTSIATNGKHEFNEVLRSNSEVMGRLSGVIKFDESWDTILAHYREIDSGDKYSSLHVAGIEATNLNFGCNCTIN